MAKNIYRLLLGTLLAWVLIVGMAGSVSALSNSTVSVWTSQSPYRHCIVYKNVRRNGRTYRVCSRWSH